MLPFAQQTHRSRLAVRLVARDGRATVLRRTLLPVIGADDVILPAFDETLGTVAIRAQEGDADARDALFFAYLPKLDKLMSTVRPPHAPLGMVGVWDRDDVEQEGYLVFLEILHGWSGDVSFTAWLLSRFSWRLKDAVLTGVGRPMVPRRQHLVPLEVAHEYPSEESAESDPDEHKLVDQLLDELPWDRSQVLVQRVLLGKPLTEVAREMQLSRRTMARYWQEVRLRAIELVGEGTPESRG